MSSWLGFGGSGAGFGGSGDDGRKRKRDDEVPRKPKNPLCRVCRKKRVMKEAHKEVLVCIDCFLRAPSEHMGSLTDVDVREICEKHYDGSAAGAARTGGAAFGRPGTQGCSMPPCPYDGMCYRKNRDHWVQYRHDQQDGPVDNPRPSGGASSASGKSQCSSCNEEFMTFGSAPEQHKRNFVLVMCPACYNAAKMAAKRFRKK